MQTIRAARFDVHLEEKIGRAEKTEGKQEK